MKSFLQRILDICLSVTALVLLTPVFTLASVRAAVCRMPVLLHRRVTTASGRTFNRYYFSRLRRLAALPALFNILGGNMSIVINISIKEKQ